jgi:hypothetical protein
VESGYQLLIPIFFLVDPFDSSLPQSKYPQVHLFIHSLQLEKDFLSFMVGRKNCVILIPVDSVIDLLFWFFGFWIKVYHHSLYTLRELDQRLKFRIWTIGSGCFSLHPAMPPLKTFTLDAILREWKAPVYDGLCNAKEWLSEIDKGCDIYGIPVSQRITVAIHFMAGEPQVVIDSMRKTKIAEESEEPWTWESFQTDFIAIDSTLKPLLGVLLPELTIFSVEAYKESERGFIGDRFFRSLTVFAISRHPTF